MNEYNKQIFASNLNKYMSERGKNQADIRKLLDVSKSTVSSWCNGSKMPRMDKIEILANYFGILKSDLIEEKPTNQSELSKDKEYILDLLNQLDEKQITEARNYLDFLIERGKK